MAMNPAALAALIQTKVQLATGNPMPPTTFVVWTAIAEAIIEHITSNAVVTVTSGTTQIPTLGTPDLGGIS